LKWRRGAGENQTESLEKRSKKLCGDGGGGEGGTSWETVGLVEAPGHRKGRQGEKRDRRNTQKKKKKTKSPTRFQW